MTRLDFDSPREVAPFPDVAERSLAWRERNKAARLAEIADRLTFPAPRTTATATDPAAPYVTQGIRTVVKLLAKHGWQHRLTRAVGPRIDAAGKVAEEQCATLCVAAQSPWGRRLVWEWRWKSDAWSFIVAQDGRTGEILNSTQASKIVKEGQPS